MQGTCKYGWILVVIALLLLFVRTELDLVVILLPVSLLLALVVGCFGRRRNRLTPEVKKG